MADTSYKTDPTTLLNYGFEIGKDGWGIMNNVTLERLAKYGVHLAVKGVLDAPPVSASVGDKYIVSNSPSGVWASFAGRIAYYESNLSGNYWTLVSPQPGWIATISEIGALVDRKTLVYDSVLGWISLGVFIADSASAFPETLSAARSDLVYIAKDTGECFWYDKDAQNYKSLTADAVKRIEIGVANGICELDSNGKVPTSRLPEAVLGAMSYQGTWNADTNTPELPAATTNKGAYWVVSTAGVYETVQYDVGDWIISNGTAYDRLDGSDAVVSVNGQDGVVVLDADDIDYDPSTAEYISSASGTIQLALTELSVNVKNAVDDKLDADGTAVDSEKLGGKTLEQIILPYSNPLEAYAGTDPAGALGGGLLVGNLTGTTKWLGGVLAPNGKIYGIPFNATQILEFDPSTGTTNLIGSLSGTNRWLGGVLAPNGKIYGIPYDATQILEFDPSTGTTNLIGSLSGSAKWYGGVLAPNGKIYGIPFNATQILEFDPSTGTTNLIGSLSGSTKWLGGVLAPNGKIYGIPYDATQILEFDPSTGTTNLIGSLSGSTKWRGGVLAPNGKIYGIPFNATQILEFDPSTGTTNLIGSLSGTNRWLGGVLAPNGKIYGIPYDATQILEFDPSTGTTNLIGSLSGSAKWAGGVLAPNGKIYGIPFNATQVLCIPYGNHGSQWWALSAYTNKF